VDVYATINELLAMPKGREAICGVPPHNWVCRPLDGKSLVPVVLGTAEAVPVAVTAAPAAARDVKARTSPEKQSSGKKSSKLRGSAAAKPQRKLARSKSQPSSLLRGAAAKGAPVPYEIPTGPVAMAKFAHDFAISQVIRCAPLNRIPKQETAPHRHHTSDKGEHHSAQRSVMWNDCETKRHNPAEMSLLGYAMRTLEYRYVAYYPYNRATQVPEVYNASTVPYEEELFDHKNETLSDFTHREITNLAYRPGYSVVIAHFRAKLVEFVLKSFANVSPHKEK